MGLHSNDFLTVEAGALETEKASAKALPRVTLSCIDRDGRGTKTRYRAHLRLPAPVLDALRWRVGDLISLEAWPSARCVVLRKGRGGQCRALMPGSSAPR